MTDAESVERILAEARPLALLQAACLLWRRKDELDGLERSRTSMQSYIDMDNAAMRRAVIYWDIALHKRARETGDDPPTIARLKRTHPAASDEELRQAIKSAILLEEERNRLAGIAKIMGEAERLPLPDAAYHLYKKKHDLDRLERIQPPPQGQNWAWQFTQQIMKERAEGYEMATFGRLKQAHPEADEAELAQALKASIKLDVDCLRHYSDDSPNHGKNLIRAIELARKDNPGFQEATYTAAFQDLAMAMR